MDNLYDLNNNIKLVTLNDRVGKGDIEQDDEGRSSICYITPIDPIHILEEDDSNHDEYGACTCGRDILE